MTTITEITVDHWAIEVDGGESLRALNIGDSVELDATTGHPGVWTVAEFIGEFRSVVRLQAGAITKDCPAAGVGCEYAGTRHTHPVDTDGHLHPLPKPLAARTGREDDDPAEVEQQGWEQYAEASHAEMEG